MAKQLYMRNHKAITANCEPVGLDQLTLKLTKVYREKDPHALGWEAEIKSIAEHFDYYLVLTNPYEGSVKIRSEADQEWQQTLATTYLKTVNFYNQKRERNKVLEFLQTVIDSFK